MPRELSIQGPDGQTRTVPFTGRLTVGRSSAAELCFPEDAGLSRQHFAFEPDGDETGPSRIWAARTGPSSITFRSRHASCCKPGDRITAGHLVIVFSPEGRAPEPGVVVFEGPAEESIRINHRRHQPRRRALNQTMVLDTAGPRPSAPMQALIRAGQVLSENKPLSELFPVILDLAIQAVTAQRGVLLILEGGNLVPRAHKGEGFRISTTVRDRVHQREGFDSGARCAAGRGVPGAA